MSIKDLEISITPGLELEYSYEYTNGEAASDFIEERKGVRGYSHFVRFKVEETSNTYFSLENLDTDLDLYLVPEMKYPEGDESEGLNPRMQEIDDEWKATWSNGSSNWGTQSEHFFRQLIPVNEKNAFFTGYYYLAIIADNNDDFP